MLLAWVALAALAALAALDALDAAGAVAVGFELSASAGPFAFALAIILSFASQEILPTPKVRMCLSSHVATLSVLRSGSVTTDKIVILPSYVSLPEDQHNQDLWPAKA